MNGRVTKYFENKGYGFILDENKENRFFHISDVQVDELIEIGMIVQFDSAETSKGKIAKNIKRLKQIKSQFIQLGKVRLKLNNIKDYGLTHEDVEYEEVEVTKLGKLQKILVRTVGAIGLVEVALGLDSMSREDIDIIFDGEYKEIKKHNVTYDVLYITTFQNDNYRFSSQNADFNIHEKLKEIDMYFNF